MAPQNSEPKEVDLGEVIEDLNRLRQELAGKDPNFKWAADRIETIVTTIKPLCLRARRVVE